MKMRVIQLGDTEFDLDAEYAGPAISKAISGESGEDVRSEIIDYTDTERSDVDRDEYAIVTGHDGTVLWQGWLDSDKDDVPPPAGIAQPAAASTGDGQAVSRDALEQLAASWEATAANDGGAHDWNPSKTGLPEAILGRAVGYGDCARQLRAIISGDGAR